MDERLVLLIRGISDALASFTEGMDMNDEKGHHSSMNILHAMLKDLGDAVGMMYDVDRKTFEGILIDTHDRYAMICGLPKYSEGNEDRQSAYKGDEDSLEEVEMYHHKPKEDEDEEDKKRRYKKAKYSHINFTPPKAVVAELKRGLEWNKEGHGGDGLKAATVSWATKMANGDDISPEKAVKMRAWLARHESDKKGKGFNPGEPGYPSPGRVAWALWGGDPAVGWSNKIVTQMESADSDKSEKMLDTIVDPVPVPPPFEPDVNPTPNNTPLPTPEKMQDPVSPPSSDRPANPPIVFPLKIEQVRIAKRKDLRNLVSSLGIDIVGPNGEPASEMMVSPLREAIIKYIESNPSEVSEEVDTVEAADLVEIEEVPTETTTEIVEDASSLEPTSKEGLLFESWVRDQAGDIKPGGTEVSIRKAKELSEFFAENLPLVQGPDREPLDTYFKKMGCNSNCHECPNGKMQPMYCYGVFDEEVTHISLNDAVTRDQFFKLSEEDGEIKYSHAPS